MRAPGSHCAPGVLAVLALGCAGGQATRSDLSGLRPGETVQLEGGAAPPWASGVVPGDHFLGVADGARSAEEAVRRATSHARSQAMMSLGVRLTAELTDVETQVVLPGGTRTDSRLEQRSRQAAHNLLLGLQPVRVHRERWATLSPSGLQQSWRAYVLVRFSPAEHRLFLERWTDAVVATIDATTTRGRTLLRDGLLLEALGVLRSAHGMGKELERITAFPPELLGRVDRARRTARTASEQGLASLRLVPEEAEVHAPRRVLLTRPVRIHARLETSGAPARGLPLTTRFVEGGGSAYGDVRTGTDGHAEVRIRSLAEQEPRHVLEVSLDPRMLPAGYASPAPARVVLQPRAPAVSLRVQTDWRGANAAVRRWEEGLRRTLGKRQLKVVGPEEPADLRLEVRLTARVSAQPGRRVAAELVGSIELRNDTAELLWTSGFPVWHGSPPRGVGPRSSDAIAVALEELGRPLLLEWLAASVQERL